MILDSRLGAEIGTEDKNTRKRTNKPSIPPGQYVKVQWLPSTTAIEPVPIPKRPISIARLLQSRRRSTRSDRLSIERSVDTDSYWSPIRTINEFYESLIGFIRKNSGTSRWFPMHRPSISDSCIVSDPTPSTMSAVLLFERRHLTVGRDIVIQLTEFPAGWIATKCELTTTRSHTTTSAVRTASAESLVNRPSLRARSN